MRRTIPRRPLRPSPCGRLRHGRGLLGPGVLGLLLCAALPGTAHDRVPDPAALGALALIPHPVAARVHPGVVVLPDFGVTPLPVHFGPVHGLAGHGALLAVDGRGAAVAIGAGPVLAAHPFGLRHGIRVFHADAHVPLVLAGAATAPGVVPVAPGRYEQRSVGEGRYQIRTPAGGAAWQVRERGSASPGYDVQPTPVGRVVVDVEPPEAEVRLDGRPLSPGSPGHFEWSLVEGRYPLDVRAPGHLDFRREVVVEPGRSTELRVKLEPLPPRRSGR